MDEVDSDLDGEILDDEEEDIAKVSHECKFKIFIPNSNTKMKKKIYIYWIIITIIAG